MSKTHKIVHIKYVHYVVSELNFNNSVATCCDELTHWKRP